jgi:Carboxypeptidase regulatory-like domain
MKQPVTFTVVLLAVALLFGMVFATPANADELYASIRGTVTDQSGAVVPDVNVTAINVATGVSKTLVSNKDGAFSFLQLPVGDYNVKIEKPGFKTYSANRIHVDVNQVYALNAKIELGTVSETITVEANRAQVETSTPQRGDVVDSNQIENLPLIGRDWVNLQQLESGVVAASDGRGEFATNGSQTTQNSFLINGTDTNDLPLNTRLVIPSEDAIQEFRMVTNTINPEYGRNSGAIVNALIKQGSNSFHGDAFEFYRDTFLNSADYFTKLPAQFHQNQFGATIGGPIWKNHAFFFFSYQGIRQREPQPGASPTTTVYSPQQVSGTGAFPGIGNCTTNGTACLSPFPLVGDNGTTYAAGTPYSTIFPAGTIPTVDINPIAANLVSTFNVASPNQADNVLSFQPIQTLTDNQYIFRIDENLGKRDLLWGSYLQEAEPFTGTLPFVGATVPGFGQVNQQHFKLLTLSWSHTLNDHMINELRAGYNRFNYAAVEPQKVVLPSTFGFNITPQDPAAAGLPVMTIAGLFDLGFSEDGPQPRIDQTYEATDNFSFTHGQHNLKAGFDMRRFHVTNPFFALNSGLYEYNGAGAYSTGVAGADFLLGIPDLFAQESGGFGDDTAQEYYTYFQDEWKIRRNLTLTYGIGWTIDTPLVDKSYGGHGEAAWYPGQQSVIYPNAPLGVVYSGDPGVHPTGTDHTFRNFGPRLGFAYSPDGKMSIRGGFGMYYNRTEEELNLQFQGVPPNSITSLGPLSNGGSSAFANPYNDISGNTALNAINPFPFAGAPSNVAFTAADGNLPVWSGCCSTIDPRNVDPTSYNYNLTFERQLTGSMIMSVAYVGSVAHHLEVGHPLNLVNPANCLADPNCTPANQLFTHPEDYLHAGNVYGSIDQISNMGNSNYNSLQVGLKKSLSRGLQFTANYTWAHALDNGSGFENTSFGGGGFGSLASSRAYNPYVPSLNYGNSAYDAPQRLVIGYTYQLPGYHSDSALISRATRGWIISGITTFQSGFPMDVVNSADGSLHCYPGNSDFACMDVPNVVAPIQYLNPKQTGNQWFSASSFAPAPEGSFGFAPRNLLHGPGINNFDFQLSKDTAITESTRLETRIEFYNLFNHTQFSESGIVTDINQGSNFGRVFADAGPRLIQLAAKFYF